jgi:hypothetical protein
LDFNLPSHGDTLRFLGVRVDQYYNPFLVGCAVGTSIMLAVVMAMHVLLG